VIAEAVDTIITLGWAFIAWLALLAAVITLALWTLLILAVGTIRLAWRTLSPGRRPAWARGRIAARRYARRPRYEEAA